MVVHKVSPAICILLSVLLLFLSQETLSRELIQVAPYEVKTVHLDDYVRRSISSPGPGLRSCPPPPFDISGSPHTVMEVVP